MYLSISPRKCSCWVKGPYTLQLRMHQFDFQVKLQGQPITTTIPQYELGWENSLHSAFKRPSPSLYLDISCLDRKHSSCNFLKPARRARDAPLARPCQSGFIRFSQKEGNTTTKSASSIPPRARACRRSSSYQWIFLTLCDGVIDQKNHCLSFLYGSSKRQSLGCVKMRWNSCVLLPAEGKQQVTFSPNFTQPWTLLLEHPCRSISNVDIKVDMEIPWRRLDTLKQRGSGEGGLSVTDWLHANNSG